MPLDSFQSSCNISGEAFETCYIFNNLFTQSHTALLLFSHKISISSTVFLSKLHFFSRRRHEKPLKPKHGYAKLFLYTIVISSAPETKAPERGTYEETGLLKMG